MTGLRLLLLTVLCCLACWLLGAVVVQGLLALTDLQLGGDYATVRDRQLLRLILLLNNLFTFGLPALLALYFGNRTGWWRSVGWGARSYPELQGRAVLTFLVGLPLMVLLVYLNLLIDLPAWMSESEDTSSALLAGVLTFEGWWELPLALLAVAVTAGVSEELMFRGLLQRTVLRPVVGGVAAIWVAAIIFSAVHLEFAGFFPRVLLGALLGYGLRWTGSLWVPILLHLAYNGVQVLVTYASGEYTSDTESTGDLAVLLPLGLLSLVGVIYLIRTTELRYRSLSASGTVR